MTLGVATVTSTIQEGVADASSEWLSVRALRKVFSQEDLNFLVTNRIPRRYATLLLGWFSQIESPALTRLSIATWQLFGGDLGLHEAKLTRFKSLQECFTRELRDGARPVDGNPAVLVSPCDAIVGALGRVTNGRVFQAKGFPYTVRDLLGSKELAERHKGALFVTLRLKSNMYHRFHAPADLAVERARYLSGDTWNVNPIALKRIERLFCKNERAVLELRLRNPNEALTLVCVASILVASIQLGCVARPFDLRYDGAPVIECGDRPFEKGAELGCFRSGSTIILFVNGPFAMADGLTEGTTVRAGQALLRRKDSPTKEE